MNVIHELLYYEMHFWVCIVILYISRSVKALSHETNIK